MTTATKGTLTELRKNNLKKVLLICGILASIIYFATDILAGTLYAGYSYSELFAIGAPTSGLVVPLFTVSSLLLLAFAFGVWKSSSPRRSRALRIMALMIIGNAVVSLILWNFFPMHMRGGEMTFTDTMHVILAINPFVPLTVVLGIVAFRNWFRFYSIGTILMMIVLSILGFMYVSQFAAQQATPWVGLYERISQYGTMLWVAVLAIVLLLEEIAREARLKASSSQHTAP
jgi:MFS family permease